MTFKSTKYAKNQTDAKKYGKKNGLFDNIRFPQLRFHCKYYRKSLHIEHPGDNLQ